ncbi:MAG: hypothetical protein PHC51_08725 [bacterium]|nr:hypothetical protein [bacterium]
MPHTLTCRDVEGLGLADFLDMQPCACIVFNSSCELIAVSGSARQLFRTSDELQPYEYAPLISPILPIVERTLIFGQCQAVHTVVSNQEGVELAIIAWGGCLNLPGKGKIVYIHFMTQTFLVEVQALRAERKYWLRQVAGISGEFAQIKSGSLSGESCSDIQTSLAGALEYADRFLSDRLSIGIARETSALVWVPGSALTELLLLLLFEASEFAGQVGSIQVISGVYYSDSLIESGKGKSVARGQGSNDISRQDTSRAPAIAVASDRPGPEIRIQLISTCQSAIPARYSSMEQYFFKVASRPLFRVSRREPLPSHLLEMLKYYLPLEHEQDEDWSECRTIPSSSSPLLDRASAIAIQGKGHIVSYLPISELLIIELTLPLARMSHVGPS